MSVGTGGPRAAASEVTASENVSSSSSSNNRSGAVQPPARTPSTMERGRPTTGRRRDGHANGDDDAAAARARARTRAGAGGRTADTNSRNVNTRTTHNTSRSRGVAADRHHHHHHHHQQAAHTAETVQTLSVTVRPTLTPTQKSVLAMSRAQYLAFIRETTGIRPEAASTLSAGACIFRLDVVGGGGGSDTSASSMSSAGSSGSAPAPIGIWPSLLLLRRRDRRDSGDGKGGRNGSGSRTDGSLLARTMSGGGDSGKGGLREQQQQQQQQQNKAGSDVTGGDEGSEHLRRTRTTTTQGSAEEGRLADAEAAGIQTNDANLTNNHDDDHHNNNNNNNEGDDEDLEFPGYWELPGGRVLGSEFCISTSLAERVREQTGLRVTRILGMQRSTPCAVTVVRSGGGAGSYEDHDDDHQDGGNGDGKGRRGRVLCRREGVQLNFSVLVDNLDEVVLETRAHDAVAWADAGRLRELTMTPEARALARDALRRAGLHFSPSVVTAAAAAG